MYQQGAIPRSYPVVDRVSEDSSFILRFHDESSCYRRAKSADTHLLKRHPSNDQTSSAATACLRVHDCKYGPENLATTFTRSHSQEVLPSFMVQVSSPHHHGFMPFKVSRSIRHIIYPSNRGQVFPAGLMDGLRLPSPWASSPPASGFWPTSADIKPSSHPTQSTTP